MTASRSFLEPGTHSIDRVTPRQRPDDGAWVIDWSLRLPSGRLLSKRSQGPTKTLARGRAKRTAERLLTTGGAETLSPGMPIAKFIAEVTVPSIESSELAASTVRLYLTAADRLVARFRGLSVAGALTYAEVSRALQGISAAHGYGAAKNAKQALAAHIVAPALARSMITTTPLPAEHPVDITTGARPTVAAPRGSADLTTAHWHRVVDHLLALDPAGGVDPPKRGRWSHADRIRKRANAIDQCLFQASTGLRLSEALGQRVDDFHDRDDGLWLTVTKPKGKKTRTIPVLIPAVAARLRTTRLAGEPDLLFPSPTNPARPWTQSASKDAMADLYIELAETLDIEPLHTLRSHAWRTVINRALIARGVDKEERVALLGHTAEVNAASYTHGRDLGPVAALVGTL